MPVYTSGTLLLLGPPATSHARLGSDGRSKRPASDERHCGNSAQLRHLQTRFASTGGEAEKRRLCRYGPCRPPAGCLFFQQGQTEGTDYRPVFMAYQNLVGRCLVCKHDSHVIKIPKADWSSVKNKQLTSTPC